MSSSQENAKATTKTVFISSTFRDLKDHRRAVWQVLKDFEVFIRGMEEFGARPAAPIETCLAEVEQCDIYVGLVAFRIGTVDQATGKSFTQLEYEHALSRRKDVLIYLADEENARIRPIDIDLDTTLREKLLAFKNTLRERHTVNTFSDAVDLAQKLRRDFKRYLPTPAEESEASNDQEFASTVNLVKAFQLRPKSVIGREGLFRVSLRGVFPASRSLCKAFNMEYGDTIGSHINIKHPNIGINQSIPFHELYATGTAADELILLQSVKKPIDLYARLHFSEDDVHKVRAEFFGRSYYVDYDDGSDGDPREQYEPPEGKAILLFSKVPTT
jgi:hypothetical protein